jgi:hypothetical protein
VAYVVDGAVRVAAPGSSTLTLVETGGGAPRWSRDGRFLAFAADGTRVYDAATGRTSQLSTEGSPVAWSSDEGKLLLRGLDGMPVLASMDGSRELRLPIAPVTDGGWLPDVPVAWLSGAGLRLLTAEDPPMLTTLLDTTVPTFAGHLDADGRLLFMADRGAGVRKHVVDLDAATLTVEADGPLLDVPDRTAFAWAPDGRNAAVATQAGLYLVDPGSGGAVPLVLQATERPRWSAVAQDED